MTYVDEESFRRYVEDENQVNDAPERFRCIAACSMLQMASMGLVIFILTWTGDIDSTIVIDKAPKLYISTMLLLYLLLVTIAKDIFVQIVVCLTYRSQMH